MRSATYLRSYRGKQSVITVGKAMTSQQGGAKHGVAGQGAAGQPAESVTWPGWPAYRSPR